MDRFAPWANAERVLLERDDYQLALYASNAAQLFTFLGGISAGTEIITLLHSKGLFDLPSLRTSPCFYYAWETAGVWPAFVPGSDKEGQFLEGLEERARQSWFTHFDCGWAVDRETLNRALQFADKKTEYADDETGFSAMCRSAGLTIAFDIALRMGETDLATGILERICRRLNANCQLDYIVSSRAGWKNAFLRPDGAILRYIGVVREDFDAITTSFVDALRTRLMNGPRRPYANASIAALIAAIDSNTRRYGPYREFFGEDPPSTICQPGVSVSTISDREKQLGLSAPLPQDYMEFMTRKNGSGAVWDGFSFHEYIGPIESVQVMDRASFSFPWRLALLPLDRLPLEDQVTDFSWPLLERVVYLNPDCEGEGQTWLVEPEYVLQARDAFLRDVYDKIDGPLKTQVDNLVKQVYGSMDEFMRLDWALLRWEHWSPADQPMNGVRGLLEMLAEKSSEMEQNE